VAIQNDCNRNKDALGSLQILLLDCFTPLAFTMTQPAIFARNPWIEAIHAIVTMKGVVSLV